MGKKLVVFIDAQNVYRSARDAFFEENASHIYGQFDPMEFGNLICARSPFGSSKDVRELSEVRIYTGRPNPSRDSKTYGAHRKQCSEWERKGALVIPRSLRYPGNWPATPAQEKGVDVAMAIDFVVMAIEHKYDVGVIASTDTDLKPAIEYVLSKDSPSVEVVAWRGKTKNRLSIKGKHLWCHFLSEDDYNKVADPTHYTIRSD